MEKSFNELAVELQKALDAFMNTEEVTLALKATSKCVSFKRWLIAFRQRLDERSAAAAAVAAETERLKTAEQAVAEVAGVTKNEND